MIKYYEAYIRQPSPNNEPPIIDDLNAEKKVWGTQYFKNYVHKNRIPYRCGEQT